MRGLNAEQCSPGSLGARDNPDAGIMGGIGGIETEQPERANVCASQRASRYRPCGQRPRGEIGKGQGAGKGDPVDGADVRHQIGQTDRGIGICRNRHHSFPRGKGGGDGVSGDRANRRCRGGIGHGDHAAGQNRADVQPGLRHTAGKWILG